MKKKLFFLFGILLLITSCSYDTTRAYQYGGYHFKQIDNRSVSFCGFASDKAARAAQAVSREFVIPKTIYGQSVTQIEREAFMSSTLFDLIVVPETVTVIGRAAFYNCSAKIDISGNVLHDEGHLPPLENNGNNGGNNNNSGSTFEQYAGSYSGTYTMDDGVSGKWSAQVESSGRMSLTFGPPVFPPNEIFYPMLTPTGDFSLDGYNGPPLQGSIRNGRVTGTFWNIPASPEQRPIGTFEGYRS